MKKTLAALMIACSLAANADTLVDGEITYTYTATEGKVELQRIDPAPEGTELDLSAGEKAFADEGLTITCLSEDFLNDTYPPTTEPPVTSIVLPENIDLESVAALRHKLRNLTSFSGGGGTVVTFGGLAYTDGGRKLVACPRGITEPVAVRQGCEEIGDSAFSRCAVQTVDLPASVTTIGCEAFYDSSLATLNGGSSIARIRKHAFGDKSGNLGLVPFLENMPDGLVVVGRTVLGWKGDAPQSVALPDVAESVAEEAFPDTVTAVDGGVNIKWVDACAFPGLVAAAPADTLVTIGTVAVGYNGNPDKLALPGGITTIAPSAFEGKASIESIQLPDSLEEIGHNAFDGCSGITEATLPDSVKKIGDGAFCNCASLGEFTFGASTESLGTTMFYNCSVLDSVYFRCAMAPRVAKEDELYLGTQAGLLTHVRTYATGWPTEGQWCGRDIEFDVKRDPLTVQTGHYCKWTLAQLGVEVPPAGTVYSVTAYGLPKGLVLKYNAAKKNKKGTIVTPAKTSWWIEGAPSATLNLEEQAAFVKVTVNGSSSMQQLALEVTENEFINLYDDPAYQLALGVAVTKPAAWLPGTGSGWVLSNLPQGLKQVTKKTTVKLNGKSVAAPAYSVYGTPKLSGIFEVTAKKKSGSWYLVRKFLISVLREDGTSAEYIPPFVPEKTDLNFNNGDAETIRSYQGGAKEGNGLIMSFTAPDEAAPIVTGAPATISVERIGFGQWALVGYAPPGDYHITVTATEGGKEPNRQSMVVHFEPLPSWARGKFAGYVDDPLVAAYRPLGYCTASVSAKGAVSGKLSIGGTEYVFTAESYTGVNKDYERTLDFSVDHIPLQTYKTTRVYNKKTKKYTTKKVLVDSGYSMKMSVTEGINGGILSAEINDEDDMPIANAIAPQNLWGSSYKSIGTELFNTSAKQQFKTFKLTKGYGLQDKESLSFKISTSGAVTVTGSFPVSKRVKKNGKWVTLISYVKPVCSTVLMPETSPEMGAAGFRGRVAVYLPGHFSGMIDFPFLVSGDSWNAGEYNGLAEVTIPGEAHSGYIETFTTKGTYNIKIKPSNLAFTGKFTAASGETVTFSGTFSCYVTVTDNGSFEYCSAHSSFTWQGWTIPLSLRIDKVYLNETAVGILSFSGAARSGATFSSEYNALANQNLWTRSDIPAGEEPELSTYEPVVNAELYACNYPCRGNNDRLSYSLEANGQVAVSGVVSDIAVKATSALAVYEATDSGYKGHFYINLGRAGIFRQAFESSGEYGVMELDPLEYIDGTSLLENN